MNEILKDKRWRGTPRRPKKNRCARCGGPTEIVKKYGHKTRACVKLCGSVVGMVKS